MWDTLSFSKEKISRFHIWNFENSKSLGRKVHFFQIPLEQPKFQQFSNFLCIFMLFYSSTFQNNFNYTSALNIREVMKFYNLVDQNFETDFSLFDSHIFSSPFQVQYGFEGPHEHSTWILQLFHFIDLERNIFYCTTSLLILTNNLPRKLIESKTNILMILVDQNEFKEFVQILGLSLLLQKQSAKQKNRFLSSSLARGKNCSTFLWHEPSLSLCYFNNLNHPQRD